MIRNDLNLLSDEEHDDITRPVEELIEKHLEKTIEDELAYQLYQKYNMDALWSESLLVILESLIESLQDVSISEENVNIIKSILANKYHLKIINDDPIEIEEIEI